MIDGLNELDWRESAKTVSVRINGLDTHYMYRDLVDVVEQAGHNVDTILVPKVGVPSDVYMVDAMLSQIEEAMGIENQIGIEVLIETTLGMANVEAIAQASPRLEAMHFGVADYAASCRARTVTIGGLNPDYPGDQWHQGLSRMLVAHTGSGRSTDPSVTSATLTVSGSRPGEPMHSAMRASGQSTRHRSSSRTRSSHRRPQRLTRRNGFWPHSRMRPMKAVGPLNLKGA